MASNPHIQPTLISYRADLTVFSSDTATKETYGQYKIDFDKLAVPLGEVNRPSILIKKYDGKSYFVVVAPVVSRINGVVGYLAAFIDWMYFENLIHSFEAYSPVNPYGKTDDLYFNRDYEPINEISSHLSKLDIIKSMSVDAPHVLTYRDQSESYAIACKFNEHVLTSDSLIQCVRINRDGLLYPIRHIRNIMLVLLLPFIIIIAISSSVIAKKILMPFKEIVALLRKQRFRGEKQLENEDGLEGKDIDSIKEHIIWLIGRVIASEKEVQKSAHLAAVGSTTAMVAHDVRKPLTSMKALLNILPHVKDDPTELAKMIATVDRSILHTNNMLNEILDFSRDATALDIKESDAQGIIASSVSDALRNHSDADVAITYNLSHTHTLKVDGNRTIRVLTNIIDNALGAMKKGDEKTSGSLEISTSEIQKDNKDWIVIKIADSGPGIPEDALSKIFDPFFTKGKKGGTGLGLAICQRVITMHGGWIEAANRNNSAGFPTKALGNDICMGAEFTIALPMGAQKVLINESDLIHHSHELKPFREEEAKRQDYGNTENVAEFMRLHKENGKGFYLLIVDDEPLFRETVQSLLRGISQVRDHIKVIETESAETALGLFEIKKFDYVITDIDMGKGRMNGYEFARTILEKYNNTRVLIHSNKRKNELDKGIREIESSRFMGFLPKPMKQEELLQFLARKTFEVVAPQRTGAPALKTKVLILNDDTDLLVSFKYVFGIHSADVISATKVIEAMRLFTEQCPDVILSDINLGDCEPDGYEFLKQVREVNKDVRFYFASGYCKSDHEARVKQEGGTGYFQLPMEEDAIKEILRY